MAGLVGQSERSEWLGRSGWLGWSGWGFLLGLLFFLQGFFRVSFRVWLGTVGMVGTVGVARKVAIYTVPIQPSRSNQSRFRSSRADPMNWASLGPNPTAGSGCSWACLDLNTCQRECHIECHKEWQRECQNMSHRMSESMSRIYATKSVRKNVRYNVR